MIGGSEGDVGIDSWSLDILWRITGGKSGNAKTRLPPPAKSLAWTSKFSAPALPDRQKAPNFGDTKVIIPDLSTPETNIRQTQMRMEMNE